MEFAVLETDGNLSVITKQQSQVMMPDVLISDGEINYEILETMGKDETWLLDSLHAVGIKNYKDIFYCVMENNGLFYIKK